MYIFSILFLCFECMKLLMLRLKKINQLQIIVMLQADGYVAANK